MAQYARREDRPDRAKCVPVLHRREVPLRAAGGQEGEHLRFSPSCQSTPFPSGRAARARVSDAFQLPPGCYGRVSGTSATPRGALGWQSCPPCCKGRLGGRRKASPTFTREARPEGGGGDSQEEGEPRVPPLLCAVRPRRPHPRQLTAGTPPFARGERSAKGGAPGSSCPTPGRPTACPAKQKRPGTPSGSFALSEHCALIRRGDHP